MEKVRGMQELRVKRAGEAVDTIVCTRLSVAQTFFSRFVGLLGKRELGPGEGLWIRPSNGVHTLGMKFAIDVVALDAENRIVKIAGGVPPSKLVFLPRTTRSVLELPSGTAAACTLVAGDQCAMSPAPVRQSSIVGLSYSTGQACC